MTISSCCFFFTISGKIYVSTKILLSMMHKAISDPSQEALFTWHHFKPKFLKSTIGVPQNPWSGATLIGTEQSLWVTYHWLWAETRPKIWTSHQWWSTAIDNTGSVMMGQVPNQWGATANGTTRTQLTIIWRDNIVCVHQSSPDPGLFFPFCLLFWNMVQH